MYLLAFIVVCAWRVAAFHKPNLVRDILVRALEALKPTHAYIGNDHGRCDQFHVRSHAFESRSRSFSQALTQELS